MAHTYTDKAFNRTILIGKERSIIIDFVLICIIIFLLYFATTVFTEYGTAYQQHFSINLSLSALPQYALLSTGRMTIAYCISLLFSFVFAKCAAANKKTEGILIPILDILQSIPILSFMPGVVLLFVALFPHSNIGLEIAAILLIFTSQVWNITFGFFQTLVTIPQDFQDVAKITHLGFWQKFTRLELPAGMISIIWNSMMSWSGGWFFLIASEQFTLGNKSFQLPGIGSYLQSAANKGNIVALSMGLLTLVIMIVILDQILWRPLVAWGDKFKLEQDESNEKPHSWVLTAISQSMIIHFLLTYIDAPLTNLIDRILGKISNKIEKQNISKKVHTISLKRIVLLLFLVFLTAVVAFISYFSLREIVSIHISEWQTIGLGSLATIGRTLAALIISLVWTIPVGVAIGMNPKLAKHLQPLVQLAASIPATALFPVLLLGLLVLPSGLSIAAVILMLLGTQWYVLFNVIAGAMAIPNDLREATTINHITGLKKWQILILPSIFPYLVTGMITATGGAWNASIISEYVTFGGKTHQTIGLGATIADAANHSNFPLLLASTVTMALIVFCINRFGWQKVYRLAERRYHFE